MSENPPFSEKKKKKEKTPLVLTAPNRVRFTANGATNLTLDCTDETEENPDWQIGEIYSSRQVQCKPVSQPLKPSQISAGA